MKHSLAQPSPQSLALLLGCFILLATSCATDAPAPQELITSLRILAVRADPPDVAPGKPIKLSALVVTPDGSPVTQHWFACRNPSQSSYGCANDPKAHYLGTDTNPSYDVPADYFPLNASTLDKFRGRYLPVTLRAQANQRSLTSTKRVVVTIFPLNQNPRIQSLEMFRAGSSTPLEPPWQAKYGETYRFVPKVFEFSRQRYPALDQSGKLHQKDEGLFFSWYVTAGALKGGRGSSEEKPHKEWIAPTAAKGPKSAMLHVILRDGRGGAHWLSHTITLTAP